MIRCFAFISLALLSAIGCSPKFSSNNALIKAVQSRLSSIDSLASSDITVRCDKGSVMLDGRVPTAAARDLAGIEADQIVGVANVVNNLKIGAPNNQQASSKSPALLQNPESRQLAISAWKHPFTADMVKLIPPSVLPRKWGDFFVLKTSDADDLTKNAHEHGFSAKWHVCGVVEVLCGEIPSNEIDRYAQFVFTPNFKIYDVPVGIQAHRQGYWGVVIKAGDTQLEKSVWYGMSPSEKGWIPLKVGAQRYYRKLKEFKVETSNPHRGDEAKAIEFLNRQGSRDHVVWGIGSYGYVAAAFLPYDDGVHRFMESLEFVTPTLSEAGFQYVTLTDSGLHVLTIALGRKPVLPLPALAKKDEFEAINAANPHFLSIYRHVYPGRLK